MGTVFNALLIMEKEYPETKWAEEMKSIYFCGGHWPAGSCSLTCPNCNTIGFYGPRENKEINRKYRACKFCGFWQEVNGEPYRCKIFYCGNCSGGYNNPANHNWQTPDVKGYNCPRCGFPVKETNWPSDDPNHPFHKILKQMEIVHKELHI